MKVITEMEYINARNTVKAYFAQQHQFTIDMLRKEAIKEVDAEMERLSKELIIEVEPIKEVEPENDILDKEPIREVEPVSDILYIDPKILYARKMKELLMGGYKVVDKDKYINVIDETSVRVANCLCKYFESKGIDLKWVDLKIFDVENLKLIKLDEIQESKNFGTKSKLVLFEMLKKYRSIS